MNQDMSNHENSAMAVGVSDPPSEASIDRQPAALLEGKSTTTTGRSLRVASFQDEDLLQGEPFKDPVAFVSELKKARLKADLFTFSQKLPDVTPKYAFHREWDNIAAIPITTHADWWNKQVEPSVRRAVRKAAKEGVVTKVAEFNDAFVNGILKIYNETPVRQGRPFWHFGKSFEDAKRENSTYSDRNIFIGAYVGDELIGFLRLTRVNNYLSIIQSLSLMAHFDKRPVNALIAKAVEVCEAGGYSHLMYCNYIYNDPNSSLTEFKRRNAFEMVLVPRYYIPLNLKGKIALKLGLHRGLVHFIPKSIVSRLLKLRSRWYSRSTGSAPAES